MNKFDHVKAVEELQAFRMTNERNSERVTILGARLIKDNYTSKLGDQSKKPHLFCCHHPLSKLIIFLVWPFYEQVAVAALDVQDFTLADVRKKNLPTYPGTYIFFIVLY